MHDPMVLAATQYQVNFATDYILGGHENAVADGHQDFLPTALDLITEIFVSLRTCTYAPGSESNGSHPLVDMVSDAILLAKIAIQVSNVRFYATEERV